MKITEIYKELDEFLDENHYLKHKQIEEFDMSDWSMLSQLTMALFRKKKNER